MLIYIRHSISQSGAQEALNVFKSAFAEPNIAESDRKKRQQKKQLLITALFFPLDFQPVFCLCFPSS